MFKTALQLVIIIALAVPAMAAKTTFVDGNPATRAPGTRVTAAFLNAVNSHRHDGQATDGSGILDYAVDSGSANAIAISLTPALTAHVPGMPLIVKVAAGNSGATTVAVNSLPAVALKKRAAALASGDLAAGQLIAIAWDGSAYQIIARESPPVVEVTSVSGQTAAQLSPPGAIIAYASTACPSGWLAADGAAVSRTTYVNLYNAVTTIWGPGDGSTTFNLPDLRGEFLRGMDNGRGVDAGRVFATAQSDLLKAHSHTLQMGGDVNGVVGWADTQAASASIQTVPGSSGTTQIVATGGAETRPRNIAILYCIKH